MSKTIFIFSVVVALVVAVLLFLNFSVKINLPDQLSKLGYTVEIEDVTFQGYKSQKISAEKGGEGVLIQTVSTVEENMAGKILEKLAGSVMDAKSDIIIFDPYTTTETELRVPEDLKPVKKETIIRDQSVSYYLVYANVIFSMRIYSEAEVRYRGLFATYFCGNDNTAYKLEIYYPVEEKFDEEKALNLFSSLYCSE